MLQEISEFLASGRKDYLDFICSLNPASAESIIKNSERRRGFAEEKFERIFLDNGIYESVTEFDFIAFSYSILKEYTKNEKLREIINAIETFPQNDVRVKKLRISLFLNLIYVRSGFFDVDLYKKVERKMSELMNTVKKIVEEEKKEIISIGFDSVMFICDKKQAKKIFKRINEIIRPLKIRMRFYDKVIKFYNIIALLSNGVWEKRLLTRTDEKYEKIKNRVIDYLKKNDVEGALKFLSTCKDINEKKINEYKETLRTKYG